MSGRGRPPRHISEPSNRSHSVPEKSRSAPPSPRRDSNSVTAQVNADGSGTLSALLLNSGGNGETETGTESWICVTEPGV